MRQITATELVQELETGTPLAILDIREVDEYQGWHIHGSTNLPVYNALNRGMSRALSDRAGSLPSDRPIVAVCRMGNTSARACEILEGLGFQTLNLRGGMRGWSGAWTEARIPLDPGVEGALIQIRRNGKGCLSYLFGSRGEGAVVDPCVEAGAYVERAKREGLTITHVIETHVHADHLSRAREIARLTGASIVLPRNGRVQFPYTAVDDGQSIPIGGASLGVVATPGHTDESVCYRIPGGVLLTGDTLFVGSVGRPDLEKGDAGAERGARALYRSLTGRLLAAGEEGRFYPGHVSGSIGFDAVAIGSTLAEERRNISLLALDEDSFVASIVKSLGAKPPNYKSVVAVNEGRAELGEVDPIDLEAGPNRCAAG